MSELLRQPTGQTPGVRWSATGVEVTDPSLPFDVYARLVAFAGSSSDAAKWALGDLLLFGEARYGELYAQTLESARISDRQAERYRYVAERVRSSRRRENLSFSHHEEVAPLEPADQARLLERADADRTSVADLRERVRDIRAVERARRDPPARQEVLGPVESVDASRNLSTVRQALATVADGVTPEAQEAIGIPSAMRALEEVGRTVRRAVAVLARPSLSEAWRLVEQVSVKQTGLADPAYIVPAEVFERFAARVAEER